MADLPEKMTEMLLKKLLQTVSSLQQDASNMKKGDKGEQLFQNDLTIVGPLKTNQPLAIARITTTGIC